MKQYNMKVRARAFLVEGSGPQASFWKQHIARTQEARGKLGRPLLDTHCVGQKILQTGHYRWKRHGA